MTGTNSCNIVDGPGSVVSSPSATGFSSGRIPALDGIRGIAILLVLLHHSVFDSKPVHHPLAAKLLSVGHLAWSGVDLFFVLSGFLIGGILLDARTSPQYYKTFYARRAFRILPVYLCVLAGFYLCLHLPSGWQPEWWPVVFNTSIPLAAYFLFAQNFWMSSRWGAAALGPTWSLAIEEQFYLTLPMVIRHINPRRLIGLLIGSVIAAPLLRTALVFGAPAFTKAAFMLMPCRADALCLGVLIAVLVRNQRIYEYVISRKKLLYLLCAVLLLGMAVMNFSVEIWGPLMNSVGLSWIALSYASLVLIALVETDGPIHRFLCKSALTQLGTLAYCTYLIHYVLIISINSAVMSGLHVSSAFWQLAAKLGAVVLTIFIAKISWRCMEKPLLNRGHAFKYWGSTGIITEDHKPERRAKADAEAAPA